MFSYLTMLYLLVYRQQLDKFDKDQISSLIQRFPLSNPQNATSLVVDGQSQFEFKLAVEDIDFDNDDNPYGQFILHRYSNMKDIEDINEDDEGLQIIDH